MHIFDKISWYIFDDEADGNSGKASLATIYTLKGA
jgi:hypothetical protein